MAYSKPFDRSEFKTRIEKIDVLLDEQEWKVKDKSKVLVEIDTKQSDFKKKQYKNVSETLKNDEESKYADYLLLDKKGYPLAVIEAKSRSSNNFEDAMHIVLAEKIKANIIVTRNVDHFKEIKTNILVKKPEWI